MLSKFQVTTRGEKKIVTVKAETPEQASIKASAKHFFGFKPKTATQTIQPTKTSWAFIVAGKEWKGGVQVEAEKEIYVGLDTGAINEGVDY
jgi:hypothetical protein